MLKGRFADISWRKRLIPFLVFLAALGSIGYELPALKDMKFQSLLELWPMMGVLFLGSILNWGLEGYKWYLLGRSSFGLTYKEALKGVLSGLTMGMFLPKRVGAWVGKMSFVPSSKRRTALFPMMASGALQFFVTVLAAFLAAALWLSFGQAQAWGFSMKEALVWGGGFSLLLALAGTSLYHALHSRLFRRLLLKFGVASGRLLSIKDLPRSLYFKVLVLALLRYSVFFLQFAIALKVLIPQSELLLLFFSVPLVLFFVSVLPSFILAKLGVREMVVVAVMAPLFGHEPMLMLASFSVWMFNLAIPAIVGGGVLLGSKPSLSSNFG